MSMFAVTSRRRAVMSAPRVTVSSTSYSAWVSAVAEVAADLFEHLVLCPEEALPGIDGEAAIGHTHKSTANAGAVG